MRLNYSQIEKIIHLYNKKQSTYTIAKELSCSAETIRYHLKKHGVVLRSLAEAGCGLLKSKETKLKMSLIKQGSKHFMYGKHHSEITKRKISKANKGKSGMIGSKNPMYGKHHTEDVKRKLSETHKGNKAWNKGKKGFGNSFFGKHHTEETKQKMRAAARKGSNHHNWNNGSSFLPYSTDWTREKRSSIKVRDNFKCQHPVNDECNGCLTVHHIDYDKMNCNDNNLITLCKGHNTKVNTNGNYWQKYFYDLLIIIEEELYLIGEQ